ncbi:terminase small subunit [Hafnia alvei]|uniref:terminase small subunit n=1 Tax=Hafnia alvei TaxID=569 RepID=UPI00242AAE4E|nr:terminase small subunit [Hafnia alvei]
MLTTKKKKFASAIKKGLSSTEAAIYAGYSEKTARVKGCQLAKDIDVKRYLERVNNSVTSTAKKVTPKVTSKVPPHKSSASRLEMTPEGIPDPIKAMAQILERNIDVDPKLALDAAFKLAQFTVRKPDQMGKKELKNEKAKTIANKFSALPAPQLTKH